MSLMSNLVMSLWCGKQDCIQFWNHPWRVHMESSESRCLLMSIDGVIRRGLESWSWRCTKDLGVEAAWWWTDATKLLYQQCQILQICVGIWTIWFDLLEPRSLSVWMCVCESFWISVVVRVYVYMILYMHVTLWWSRYWVKLSILSESRECVFLFHLQVVGVGQKYGLLQFRNILSWRCIEFIMTCFLLERFGSKGRHSHMWSMLISCIFHRIGWWENLEENPIFDGNIYGFP